MTTCDRDAKCRGATYYERDDGKTYAQKKRPSEREAVVDDVAEWDMGYGVGSQREGRMARPF